jgi:hypothetical protein
MGGVGTPVGFGLTGVAPMGVRRELAAAATTILGPP